MSYTLTPEQQISMWIANVRWRMEDGDVKAALTFLGVLEGDWEKRQHGELEPLTIHTGNKMLIEHFEGQSMSFTLFHCSRCNIYINTGITVSLRVSAYLDPVCGMLCVGDDTSLPEGYSIPLENVVECLCPECEKSTELIVLDECPHRWRGWQIDQWGKAYSTCQFCGERRGGQVKYVTEFSE